MAFSANQFGRSIAAPGLIVPNQPSVIDSGVMQEDKNVEGGFPLFGKFGSGAGCWLEKSTAADAVARVVAVTPTIGTAASGTVTLKKNGVSVATATTTSESTVATLVAALAASFSSTGYVAANGTTKLNVTASTAGNTSNDDVFTVDAGTSGFTFAVADTTAGSDAVAGGYFKGIAQRTTCMDGFVAGEDVNVVRKGQIWVTVSGEVLDGKPAYLGSDYAWTADSEGTLAVAGATFKTSASDGGLAVVELA